MLSTRSAATPTSVATTSDSDIEVDEQETEELDEQYENWEDLSDNDEGRGQQKR